MVIHFVTTNDMKYQEIKRLIPSLQKIEAKLPEIQSLDPKEVIIFKLNFARSMYPNFYLLVDDTSLYLECFEFKLPGPFISYFMQTLGADGLFKISTKLGGKKVIAKTLLGLMLPGSDPVFFEGLCEGEITKPDKNSFTNWDSIFKPIGSDKTFSEMTKEEKNLYSMRSKAVQKLISWLNQEQKCGR